MKVKRISIIGAGKLGSSFALELKAAGYEISYIFDKNFKRAKRLAKISGADCSKTLSLNILSNSDMIVISVNDDEISAVAKKIRFISLSRKKIFLVHTSGALTSKILKPSGFSDSDIASFHPIQTFKSISYSNMNLLKNIYFGIEGGKNAVQALKSILKFLESKYILLNHKDKILYHIICVFASNFIVANFFLIKKLSVNLQIEEKKIIKALLPLSKTTLENIGNYGIYKSITGPVSREDWKTVNSHLLKLKSLNPDISSFYKKFNELLIELCFKNDDIKKT